MVCGGIVQRMEYERKPCVVESRQLSSAFLSPPYDRKMLRRFLRSVGLLGVLGLISQSLSAQERFDIAVYPYATAHRGEWELEGLLNFSSRGTGAFDGQVAPTQGQWRFAAEVTRGITDHWQLAGYLLGAQTPGLGLDYAGWRLRSRMRAPESWPLPVTWIQRRIRDGAAGVQRERADPR